MRTFKTLILTTLAAAVFASPAWAQFDMRDATLKIRGAYGQKPAVSRQYNVQRSAPAPVANRTFSYEPAPAAAKGCPVPAAPAQAAPAPATVNVPQRTFSYEPAPVTSGVQSYRAPRGNTPIYMRPKSDPRRYDSH